MKGRLDSIDAIKGIALISIIAIHSGFEKSFIYFATIDQAVPLFFIATGFTFALYFEKSFSITDYFKKKFNRFYLPIYFIIPFFVLLNYHFNLQYYFSPYWLLGYMRGFIAGAYFITAYLQWIIIFPLVYYSIKKRIYLILPIIILFFAIHGHVYLNKEIFVELLPGDQKWNFMALIFTYLPHLSLGLLFGLIHNKFKPKPKLSYIILTFLLASLFLSNRLYGSRTGWNNLNPFTLEQLIYLDFSILYTFSLFIFLYFFFQIIPSRISRPISFLGMWAYEIYLIQGVFFLFAITVISSQIFQNQVVRFFFSLVPIVLLLPIYNYSYSHTFGRLIKNPYETKYIFIYLSLILSMIIFLFFLPPSFIEPEERLLTKNECPNCDLSRINLRYAILNGANLEGAWLDQADLSYSDLSGANLNGTTMRAANLRGVDLDGGKLIGADMSFAILSNAYLEFADLSNSNLKEAVLRDTDLYYATLYKANLQEADMSNANLKYVDLRYADLTNASLRGADLSYAKLNNAILNGADLSYANLKGTNLSGAKISNTTIFLK